MFTEAGTLESRFNERLREDAAYTRLVCTELQQYLQRPDAEMLCVKAASFHVRRIKVISVASHVGKKKKHGQRQRGEGLGE